MRRWLKIMGYSDDEAAQALGYKNARSIRAFKLNPKTIPMGTRKLMTAIRTFGEFKPWK